MGSERTVFSRYLNQWDAYLHSILCHLTRLSVMTWSGVGGSGCHLVREARAPFPGDVFSEGTFFFCRPICCMTVIALGKLLEHSQFQDYWSLFTFNNLPPNDLFWISTHLKLCLADAIHNSNGWKLFRFDNMEVIDFENIWHVQKLVFKVLIKNENPNLIGTSD